MGDNKEWNTCSPSPMIIDKDHRHVVLFPHEEREDPAKIATLEDLDKGLPSICNNLAEIFGSRNLESTYQKALAIDLRNAGAKVVSEVPIDLLYRGQVVGKKD